MKRLLCIAFFEDCWSEQERSGTAEKKGLGEGRIRGGCSRAKRPKGRAQPPRKTRKVFDWRIGRGLGVTPRVHLLKKP